MAMTLRLEPQTEQALDTAASRTGKSKQRIITEAINAYLGLVPALISEADALAALGVLDKAQGGYREIHDSDTLELPAGKTSLDLLERADRV